MKKKVVIIGAGPAGLSAGYTILKNSDDYEIIIIEKDKQVGGISKTINYNGNRMDLGGHRFFTKEKRINDLWEEVLPIQGYPSYDDKKLNINKEFKKNGPNPEKEDKVFLIRNRVSRIYYCKKFFSYPVSLSFNTIKNLGFIKTIVSGFSYLKSLFIKKEESNLENFYINRFGKKLYTIFFEGYTEKLWGRSPKNIDSSWGKQRVKGLSIIEILKDAFCKIFKIKTKKQETSLIEQFHYPKYGPGQMYEEMANIITKKGGKILKEHEVIKINNNKSRIKSILCEHKGKIIKLEADYFISSMPIKDLINEMDNVPNKINRIASELPYRDFVTVGLVVDKLKIKNNTKIKTLNNIVPDCWIYIQTSEVKLGRIQIFNNWSPYLVKEKENTVSLGLEFFCFENDEFWNKKEKDLVNYAKEELISIGLIDKDTIISDSHVEKVKKAYPAYFDSYNEFDKIKKYLDNYDNLYCIGRNGQHRYNNMDHSMMCGIVCAENIINNIKNKDNIWSINTEENYHEEKK